MDSKLRPSFWLGAVTAFSLLCAAASSHALQATYVWEPDAGFAGSGTLVLDDPNITDAANFGFPGAIVDDDSLVSLAFSFPANAETFDLAAFDLQNVANDLAVGAGGWSASGGVLTNVFLFSGDDPMGGIQLVRLGSDGPAAFADLSLVSGGFEEHRGRWRLVPEPSTGALFALGLGFLATRRRRA
ncbi:MAG: PEP-CTERM sorting domain-containing protein [Myxococcota bacterium]